MPKRHIAWICPLGKRRSLSGTNDLDETFVKTRRSKLPPKCPRRSAWTSSNGF